MSKYIEGYCCEFAKEESVSVSEKLAIQQTTQTTNIRERERERERSTANSTITITFPNHSVRN